MKKQIVTGVFATLLLFAGQVIADANEDQRKELLRVQKTTFKLIDLLVEEGLLSPEKAQRMKQLAEQEAILDLQKELAEEPIDPSAVRVPYVPEFVQEQIREDLRKEVKEDVLEDVLKQASEERWGLPGTWPEWVDRITVKGDVRVRYEMVNFGDNNFDAGVGEGFTYVDVNAINEARRFQLFNENNPDEREQFFLNTSEDFDRLRVRARLEITGNISNNWHASMRFKTGNRENPIGCCTDLGRNGDGLDLFADKGYIGFDWRDSLERSLYSFKIGRLDNPFFRTDLIWDADVTFDGVTSEGFIPFSKKPGYEQSGVFGTLGAFLIGDFNNRGQQDKRLYAGQLGVNWQLTDHHRAKISTTYYDYDNIVGVANEANRRTNDFTATEFVTRGNTLFNIDGTQIIPGERTVVNDALFGYASDYNLLNYLVEWEWSRFQPINVLIYYDYVENVGWDTETVEARANSSLTGNAFRILTLDNVIEERTTGYKYGVKFGHRDIENFNDWSFELAYRYLEADAVLDAFTDSDFHGGGTDAKGTIIRGDYGIGSRTKLTLRYLSADEIDGIPLKVNTWQINWLNRF